MANAIYFQKTGVPLSVFWIILKMKSQSCIYASFFICIFNVDVFCFITFLKFPRA